LDTNRYDRQQRIWGEKGQERLRQARVLIAGAGGIGSEIIKNLALLGIGNITIIDMDLIELTNLNRQLLFSNADIGKFKAEIAAKKGLELNPDLHIQFLNDKLQSLPNEVFTKPNVFISALDNIPARIFLNQKAVLLNKPLIDGGSEGFFGHVQVVIPHITPCLLCHDIWSRSDEKFKCSYAINPRTPLDCVLEGRDKFYLQYNQLPDANNPDHLQFIYKFALEHAQKHDIVGVTFDLVKDSLKGTVAALITTNAIIGAVMTNELLKILLQDISIEGIKLAPLTYYQFNGISESGWPIPLERNEKCPICSLKKIEIEVPAFIPLIQFIDYMGAKLNFDLKAPLLLKGEIILYREPSLLKNKINSEQEIERIQKNQIRPVSDFFNNGDTLFLKDESVDIELWITVKFMNEPRKE
jgi:ubiquitin-activating enzyme E1 C